jgi:hypothetical protein
MSKDIATPEPKAKAKVAKTRKFRGQECPIVRTTKNRRTGAIYDLVLHTRSVTNRRTGDASKETVGHKLRRPGTGSVDLPAEYELDEEEEE